VEWFCNATPDQQKQAVAELFEHAILSEWIDIRDDESQQWLADETGEPIENFGIPFFTTCGDPIASPTAAVTRAKAEDGKRGE
jgi:hypothetical protein